MLQNSVFHPSALALMSFFPQCCSFCSPTCRRKAQESQKEMKLLLDMYRSAPKEQRDKVQLMAAEKKSKAEVTEPSVICPPGDNLHLWRCPLFFHL